MKGLNAAGEWVRGPEESNEPGKTVTDKDLPFLEKIADQLIQFSENSPDLRELKAIPLAISIFADVTDYLKVRK